MTADAWVSSADAGFGFWRTLIGREPDVMEASRLVEWRLIATPEVSLRVIIDESRAGSARVSLAVADLAATVEALEAASVQVPTVDLKPGVMASVTLHDPDGNAVTIWEDLLRRP